MVKQLDDIELKETEESTIYNLTFMIGFSMNISQVIYGFNMAASDIILALLIMYTIASRKLTINRKILIFCVFLVSYRLLSTMLLNYWIPLPVSVYSTVATCIKFFINLLYLFLFASLFEKNRKSIDTLLSGVMYGAIFLGAVSLLIYLIGPNVMRGIVLFGDIRLRGFMNDPNYFGYMQISGYAIWLFNRFDSKIVNIVSFSIFIVTILLTASKTALIVVIFITACFFLWRVLLQKKKLFHIFTVFTIATLILLLVLLNMEYISLFFKKIILENPQIARTVTIFSNPDNAISGDGSGRISAWKTAIQILERTKSLGIGFVDYSTVASSLTGSRTIAHNTYLQLAVEWGIIPTLIGLFFFVKNLLDKYIEKDWTIVFLMLVLMVFSFSISFQNSRLLWCILAILSMKERRKYY